MARYGGRDVVVRLAGVPIAVVREKTLTHAKEGVDVTADEDDGWRRLLPISGSRSVDAAVNGVVADENITQLQNLWVNDAFADVTIEYPDGSIAEAEDGFFLNGFEVSGSQDGEAAFSATLQSSGPVTITPAP